MLKTTSSHCSFASRSCCDRARLFVATFSMDPRWRFTAAVVRIGIQPTCGFAQRPIDLPGAHEGLAPVKLWSTDLFGALTCRPIRFSAWLPRSGCAPYTTTSKSAQAPKRRILARSAG